MSTKRNYHYENNIIKALYELIPFDSAYKKNKP